jgi:hypothetical protein
MKKQTPKLSKADVQRLYENQLKYLARHFGPKLVETLLAIPYLVRIVRTLVRRGWKIRVKKRMLGYSGYYKGAFSTRSKKTVYIGAKANFFFILISIAHEYVHAVVMPTKNPRRGSSCKRFIERCLTEEAKANLYECRVIQALLDMGYTFKDIDRKSTWAQDWYKTSKKGLGALKEKVRRSQEGTEGMTYPEFYRSWYEEKVPYRYWRD